MYIFLYMTLIQLIVLSIIIIELLINNITLSTNVLILQTYVFYLLIILVFWVTLTAFFPPEYYKKLTLLQLINQYRRKYSQVFLYVLILFINSIIKWYPLIIITLWFLFILLYVYLC